MSQAPKVVISGYYGFDNCGDEAVLLAMVHCIKKLKPDVRIVVLSGNPEQTRELYPVEAVNRWNPFAVAVELLSCRLLISGGGSLLQDVTSTKSLRYYLSIINMAAILRKKIMIYGQGIGPLTMKKSRTRVSRAINRCHVITVRDDRSAELLKELGITREILVTCDPVMAFPFEGTGWGNSEFGIRNSELADEEQRKITDYLLKNIYGYGDVEEISPVISAPGTRKLLMVSIRHWNDDRHIPPVAEFLDIQAKNGWNVLLVPAHYPDDMEALDSISQLMTQHPNRMDKCMTALEFLSLADVADMVFSMRLHGLICAFATGTPMLGLSYDPKVDAFMEQAGLGRYCLPYDGFDCETADSLLKELEDTSSKSLQDFEKRRKNMRDIAWETAKKAADMLEA